MRPLRHGYTNDVRGDGAVVVKAYTGPDADNRRATERDMLRALAGRPPVPEVLDDPPGELHLSHLPGENGQDLITAGHAGPVLHACGAMARRLADAGVHHGDFGPNNVLLDPATFTVTAVLDWEWAEPRADPVDDLGWCEWIVRTHHPGAAAALGELFAGYGSCPPWPQRHAAMLAKCRSMLALRRRLGPDDPGFQRWQRLITETRAWGLWPWPDGT